MQLSVGFKNLKMRWGYKPQRIIFDQLNNMKGILIAVFFSILALFSEAQVINFNINGEYSGTDGKKFAYLTTLSQQRPKSSDKIFLKVPIIDGKFKFDGKFDLMDEFYQNACVFLDTRGDITKQEAVSKFYNIIWVVGREKNLHHIILENMQLKFVNEEMSVASGGMLTKQHQELQHFYKQKSNILVNFIKQYPDSPVSYYALEGVYSLYDKEDYDRIQQIYGNPYEMYNLLSLRLKQTKKGIQLKKDIDGFFKN